MTESVRMGRPDLEAIRHHASRGYPEEVCGVLVGRDEDGRGRAITRVVPIDNSRVDERARRYIIPPESLRQAERSAAAAGLDVIGFYHSHPDHPAEPSVYDREHAWPWYTYVIVPVMAGASGEPRAWRLLGDRAGFPELRIESADSE